MKTGKDMEHIPVLLDEVIDGLNIKEDGTYCDLTLGRAGHSSEILKRLSTGLLIGLDQDEIAIEASRERLSRISLNFKLIHANFSEIKEILSKLRINKIDGCLMDLGVSSPQFDTPERGFSYRYDAKLDMRMNLDDELTAYDIVNKCDLEALTKIFREYGDEKYAYQIAKKIVAKREIAPIVTTFDLVDIIKSSLPPKELKKKGHPAKQVFQALRIATNNEYEVLKTALKDVTSMLNHGGRLAVITFHSGEDRIVKKFFKELTSSESYSRYGPAPIIDNNSDVEFRLVNKNVIVASEEELNNNPRSTSAKLRIIERI